MRLWRFPLDHGSFDMSTPDELSMEDLDDCTEIFALAMRSLRRSAIERGVAAARAIALACGRPTT